MDEKLFEDRMSKFDAGCRQMDAMPEVLLARIEKRGYLMITGPVVTLESLKEFRAAMNGAIDVKEMQLLAKG